MYRRVLPTLAVALTLAVVLVPGTAFAIDRSPEVSEEDVEVVNDQTLTLELPELTNKAAAGGSCSAELDCGDGNVVSCTGSNTCRTTIAGVECDGNEVRCPNFCSVGVQCECGLRICWSTSGDCTQFPPTCDGFELQCFCPPTQQ